VSGYRRVWLIRYSSEIFTKGESLKRNYIFLLQKNIEEALRREGKEYKIWRDRDRVYVECDDDISGILGRIFGISSFSPSYHVEFLDLEDLKGKVAEIFGDEVKGKKFAVRAKVRDKNISVRRLESEIGSALYPFSSGVDLENPEIQVNLEIRGRDVFIFTENFRGMGGFPSGTQGKAVSLISGGFDSAVASWLGLKRGLKLYFLLFDIGGIEHVRGTYSVVKKLYERWIFGYKPELFVMSATPLLKGLTLVKPKYRLIIIKRFMYRLAEILAKNLGAKAIITGESLGQVLTQTMSMLGIIEEAINIPVFRPLIFMDKEEIIGLARKIGTYSISERIPEFCAIAPPPPPKLKLSDVKREEEKVLNLLEEIVSTTKKLDISSEDVIEDELFIRFVPPNAEVINLEEVDIYELIDSVESLDRGKIYVFVCKEGVKSRQMAKLFRERGFKAFYTTLSSLLGTPLSQGHQDRNSGG
jgi:thiamine biosynthesis protein ThiI